MVRDLSAHGLKSFSEPMSAIAPLPFAAPDLRGVRALAFSSAHAPALFANKAPRATALPAYTVGRRAAQAAQEAGWTVACTEDTATALAPRLPADTLHVRGHNVVVPLGDQPPCTVYTAQLSTRLSDACAQRLKDGAITHALLLSARAGRRLVRLAAVQGLLPALARVHALCLSPRVVSSVRAAPWASVRAPNRPRAAELLDLLETP